MDLSLKNKNFIHYLRMNTITDLLYKGSHDTPDNPLYFFLGKNSQITDSLTYEQTYKKAAGIALTMVSTNMFGERCILMYQPGLEIITAFFGCLYAGVIAVPAFPLRKNSSSRRIMAIITDSGATAVCTTRKTYDSISTLFGDHPIMQNLKWICTDEVESDDKNFAPTLNFGAEDIAYLQYTSGSTGNPKGVIVTHGNIMSNLIAIDESCKHTPQSKIVSWMPVFHDMGLIYGVLQPIYNQCVSYLMPPMLVMQNPFEWLNAISTYKANYSTSPNFAYDHCVAQISDTEKGTLDLSSWIAAGCAAEPVRPQTLKNFADSFSCTGFTESAFAPCYGLAEATLKVTGLAIDEEVNYVDINNRVSQLTEGIGLNDAAGRLAGCGSGAVNTTIKIVNPETGIECSSDGIGEIWVQSPSVALGYWNKPKETEETFKASIRGVEGYFLRTGDLGFIFNRQLYVAGRLKELIIIRGTNHYPQDIEYTIQNSHPILKHAFGAAFSVNSNGNEELVAVYELDNTAAVNHTLVKQVISAAMEAVFQNHEIRLHDIVFIRNGTLPKTSSGKIQRVICRSSYINSALENLLYGSDKYARQEVPSTLSESGVPVYAGVDAFVDIKAWLLVNIADTLNLQAEELEDDEPLASYGLDSSVAAALTGKINEQFNLEVQPTVFWEYSTIAELSSHIKRSIEQISVN